MNSQLNTIRSELKKQRDQNKARAAELLSEAATLQDEVDRLEAALNALDGKPANGKPVKRSVRKAAKPCATKDDVLAVLMTLLADNGEMPADDLEELAKSKIVGQGKSLSGFQLRRNEAIGDGRIETDQAGMVRPVNVAAVPASV